jgi:hypothetical protein
MLSGQTLAQNSIHESEKRTKLIIKLAYIILKLQEGALELMSQAPKTHAGSGEAPRLRALQHKDGGLGWK